MISLQNPTPDLQARSSIFPSSCFIRLHKNDDFGICNLGASSIIISFSLISDCILLSLLHFDDFFRCTAAHLLSSWAGYNLIHSMPWSPWEWESISCQPREGSVRTRRKRRHTFSYCNMISRRASSVVLLQITLTPTFSQKT